MDTSIGSIVSYVHSQGDAESPSPAIVTNINEDGTINLFVFLDNRGLHYTDFQPSVKYSEGKEKGTWCNLSTIEEEIEEVEEVQENGEKKKVRRPRAKSKKK